nr:unnamed protein product [Digitaria exilis]
MAAETNGADPVSGGEPRRRHVLLFPVPYQGHINPMFQLAGVLHARGFAITVFHTHFNAPDPARRHPDYRFVPVLDGMSGVPAPVAIEDVVAHIISIGAACQAAFEDRLAAVLDEYSRDAGVAFLVADAHLLEVFQVASKLPVPTLALRTGSAVSFACFAAYPMLCEKGYLPLDMAVEELPPYRVRDLMHVGRDGHDAMSKMMARAVAAVNLSSGLVLNTLDALERRELEGLRRDLAVPVFDVGPLHKLSPAAGDNSSRLLCQDRSCLEWLDAWPPSSVLYVSFGSLACMTPRDMVETAWGIAGSGVSFIWVVRPGLVRGCAHDADQLPVGFEAATRQRGMVVAWAPQEEVLRHRGVGGFWTHNGWNSTMESVVEGRGKVEAAIRRLMTDRDGVEMRARAGELKKAAAECTGKGGMSCLAIDKMVRHMMSL